MTTFLFLRVTHDPSELPRTAVTRGEPRIRPSDRDPGAGSSWLPRFARPRCLDRRDTFLELPRGSSVPIDVHGSLDRAKDVSPKTWRRFLGVSRDECVHLVHADDVPFLILPEDTCCHRCDRLPGNEPQTPASDRPRLTFFRQPAKAAGIP
jgi:hypothetical protein